MSVTAVGIQQTRGTSIALEIFFVNQRNRNLHSVLCRCKNAFASIIACIKFTQHRLLFFQFACARFHVVIEHTSRCGHRWVSEAKRLVIEFWIRSHYRAVRRVWELEVVLFCFVPAGYTNVRQPFGALFQYQVFFEHFNRFQQRVFAMRNDFFPTFFFGWMNRTRH